MSKVWIITGCSTGFGRELAKQTLAKGYKVAVTARNPNDIQDIVVDYPDTSLALKLDVTKPQEIKAAIVQVNQKFGQIDVLVNNAGIGYFGAVEESEDKEVRRMFEINYFGLIDMTNEVLPTMRKQHSGHIINIASIAGLVGFPAVGHYNATKFAVDGVSESLSKELAPIGIKVTIISPSGFRTDWAGRSANEAAETIDDYKQTAEANKNNIRNASGNQAGDPVRGAEAIIKVTEVENPPLRLLLGKAALTNARQKLDLLKQDFDAWEETTVWADNPKQQESPNN